MPPISCPSCQTIRHPNAAFCPTCGLAFDGSRPARLGLGSGNIELGVWSGVKFGAGFTVGAAIVGIVGWVALLGLIFVGLNLPSVR